MEDFHGQFFIWEAIVMKHEEIRRLTVLAMLCALAYAAVEHAAI